MQKLKKFYHKFDVNLSNDKVNFTVTNILLVIISFILIFVCHLFMPTEVKADTISRSELGGVQVNINSESKLWLGQSEYYNVNGISLYGPTTATDGNAVTPYNNAIFAFTKQLFINGSNASFYIFVSRSNFGTPTAKIGDTTCKASPTSSSFLWFLECNNIQNSGNTIEFYWNTPESFGVQQHYMISDITYNKSQETLQEETNDKIDNINDTLTDSSVDAEAISGVGDNLPPTNGVLSSLINLPVRFFQTLLNSLNTTTCPIIKFQLPFVHNDVSIPCIRNLLDEIGALDFYETIGTMVGGLLMFKYLIYMGKSFSKMSNLESTGNESWGGL